MARIAGINIPDHKHAEISLTAIYGIGRQTARNICAEAGITPAVKIKELTEEQLDTLRNIISKMTVEGDLRREASMNIVIGEYGIVAVCRYADKEREQTPVRVKVRANLSKNNVPYSKVELWLVPPVPENV